MLKSETLITELQASCAEKDLYDDSSHKCSYKPQYCNFQTKHGKEYTPKIRKLYCSLLSSQVPPGKIASIIMKLPAAGYMHREELSTAHQAYLLSEHIASGKFLCLNSDGTTKCQKKLV